MTTFDALVSMAQLVLRARGEWQMGATAYADIERAVSDCAEAIRGDEWRDLIMLDQIKSAIAELKLRATPAVA
jgi:hypothetical protein